MTGIEINTSYFDVEGSESLSGTGSKNNINIRKGLQVVILFESGTMNAVWLHDPPIGMCSFEHENEKIKGRLHFVANDSKWFVNVTDGLQISDGDVNSLSLEIYNQCMYNVLNVGEKCVIYAEEINKYSAVFHNYYIQPNHELKIGRTNDNDIVYPSEFVSRLHATLLWDGARFLIKDFESLNGTYVNGKRISYEYLNAGDVVFIMGLKLIMGIGFVSINDGNCRINIIGNHIHRLNNLYELDVTKPKNAGCYNQEDFNRNPRRRISMEQKTISIAEPPFQMNDSRIPMFLNFGGRIAMSSTSIMAGHYASLLGTLLFPMLTQKYTDKQKKEYEELRQTKYREYLYEKSMEIQRQIEYEDYALNENYQSLNQIIQYTDTGERLWERRIIDDDFLKVRVGYGSVPINAKLDYPEKGFDMQEDPLLQEMYTLVEKPAIIPNAPIMISFMDEFVCGVRGLRKLCFSFAKRILIQMCVLHSYDELKIIILANNNDLKHISFVKNLPHLWTDQKDFRFLATNNNEALQISEYLKKIIEDNKNEKKLKDILKRRPYYMIFAFDKSIFDSMEVLKDIMKNEGNTGFSVMTVFEGLPKECMTVFDLNSSGNNSIIHLRDIDRADDAFKLDLYDKSLASLCVKRLSNIHHKAAGKDYTLPKMLSFMQMFNAGRVDHLNCLRRWQENNPVNSLAAQIGVYPDGSPFTLDLHEKYQGPHGLVAGMTGSGKSEFIITYILSLAVNYHPNEVAFVLIDYKGGGLAGAFADEKKKIFLPHIAGTITNLDGAAIQRSLMSIQSELKRRQRIFNEVKSATDEGTMDIYTYQRLYRENVVKEPLPHLFIISDEFAELKKQEPEFMNELISAARIGRSLGVHLILATQKPSGVVNDQIWSNSKFRVCLRVQDKSDSMEMLKRPEAAELKDTGRFYLQVGYNEFFALGQSAWCGADYEPSDDVIKQKDDEIIFVDNVGQSLAKIRPEIKKESSGVKQVVAIVKYLTLLAEQEGIKTRQLWAEPLKSHIILEDLIQKYNIKKDDKIVALVGEVDDPMNQSQYPLKLELQNYQNVLLSGEGGSGKTTFVMTMIYFLVSNYSPEQLNLYIMDFSSGNLKEFGKLPHCGAVLTEDHENQIEELLELLQRIISERKKMFVEAGVNNYEAYIKRNPIPYIVLVIDNYAFIENLKQSNDKIVVLKAILKSGPSYGVNTIITVNHTREISFRIRQDIGYGIALKAKDRYDYMEILGKKTDYVPPEVNGRGLCVFGDECKEYQTATIGKSDNEIDNMLDIRSKVERLCEVYKDYKVAAQLEIIDENEEYTTFCNRFNPERIPLGYDESKKKGIAVPLQQLDMMSVYLGNEQASKYIINNLMYAMKREHMQRIVIKKQKDSVFDTSSDYIRQLEDVNFYETENNVLTELVNWLLQEFKSRVELSKQICEELKIQNIKGENSIRTWRKQLRRQTQPIFLLIESLADVCALKNSDIIGKLRSIFEHAKGYNIYIINVFYSDDLEKLVKLDKSQNDVNKQEVDTREHLYDSCITSLRDKDIKLLFGGCFDKQKLVILTGEHKRQTLPCKKELYGQFILCLKGQIHILKMPLGDLTEETCETDDEPFI